MVRTGQAYYEEASHETNQFGRGQDGSKDSFYLAESAATGHIFVSSGDNEKEGEVAEGSLVSKEHMAEFCRRYEPIDHFNGR